MKQAEEALRICEGLGLELVYQDFSLYGGMQLHKMDREPLTAADVKAVVDHVRPYKRTVGYYVWDEPFLDDQLQEARRQVDMFQREDPSRCPFTVAIPSYNGKMEWDNGEFAGYSQDSKIPAEFNITKYLKENGLAARSEGIAETVTAQIPAAGQSVPGGSQVLLYFGEEPEKRLVEVPDFAGMNRQQASDTALALGLFILVSGNSSVEPDVIVTAQSVPKNTKVPVGTTIRLEFADTKIPD